MSSISDGVTTMSGLRAQLHALPKIDLHRHLEGSLRLETLAEIAQEHGIDLPGHNIEALRPLVTVTNEKPDFKRFLEKFGVLRRFYRTQAAVERVAYEAVADASADNIRYLELRFNPVALTRVQGFTFDQVTTWVCSTVASAQRDLGIRANLILQIGRDESVETAFQIAEVAIAHREDGVVGLDLAGDETSYPASGFSEVFRRARLAGLGLTLHAGEVGSAANVREAIGLGAQRIGHGVRTVEDSEVVQLVHDQGIALEMCPTSNIQTGVVRRFWQHPLPDLLALNLRVTINTDDPSVSDTTLTDEYMTAVLAMGVTLGQIKQMILLAAEASFQPAEERNRMVDWFRDQLAQH